MDAKFQPAYASAVRHNTPSSSLPPKPNTDLTSSQQRVRFAPTSDAPAGGAPHSQQPSGADAGGAPPGRQKASARVVSAPPTESSSTAPPGSTQSGQDDYEFPRDQRRRQNRQQRATRKTVYGSSDSSSALRAGKRFQELFIFNLDHSTSADDVTTFLSDNEITACEIDVQSKENATNRSFRLKVESSDADKLLKPEFWPSHIGVRPFYRKRARQNAELIATES